MAVYVTNIKQFAENLVSLSLTNEIGVLLAEVIQDWIDENPDYWELELSQEDLNALLKELTCCIVGTGTTLTCYPTGLITAILFDIDGNPIS